MQMVAERVWWGVDSSLTSNFSIVCTFCMFFFNDKFCYRYIFVLCVCIPQFPMGSGGDGPLGGMAGMEPHHMNGSLGE